METKYIEDSFWWRVEMVSNIATYNIADERIIITDITNKQ